MPPRCRPPDSSGELAPRIGTNFSNWTMAVAASDTTDSPSVNSEVSKVMMVGLERILSGNDSKADENSADERTHARTDKS